MQLPAWLEFKLYAIEQHSKLCKQQALPSGWTDVPVLEERAWSPAITCKVRGAAKARKDAEAAVVETVAAVVQPQLEACGAAIAKRCKRATLKLEAAIAQHAGTLDVELGELESCCWTGWWRWHWSA
jgi:hypothetical protein